MTENARDLFMFACNDANLSVQQTLLARQEVQLERPRANWFRVWRLHVTRLVVPVYRDQVDSNAYFPRSQTDAAAQMLRDHYLAQEREDDPPPIRGRALDD